jgi:hypothetical protein
MGTDGAKKVDATAIDGDERNEKIGTFYELKGR